MKRTFRSLLCALLAAALLCPALPTTAKAASGAELRRSVVSHIERLATVPWRLTKRITRTAYLPEHIAAMQRAGVRHSVFFEYIRAQTDNIGVLPDSNSASFEKFLSGMDETGTFPDLQNDYYPGMGADSLLTDVLARVIPDRITGVRQALTASALVPLLPQANVSAGTSRQAADAAGFAAASAAYAKLQPGDLLIAYEEPIPEQVLDDNETAGPVEEREVPVNHVLYVTGVEGEKVSVVYMGYTDPIYTFVCSGCGAVEKEGPTRNPVPDHLNSKNYAFDSFKTHKQTDPSTGCAGTWVSKGGTIWQHETVSYDQLFGRGGAAVPYGGRAYLPYTLAAYSGEGVPVDVKTTMLTNTTADNVSAGIAMDVSSNYRINQIDAVLSSPGKADQVFTDYPEWDAWTYRYENAQLNRTLFECEPGSYTLTVNVHSGPLTGQDYSVVKVFELNYVQEAAAFTLHASRGTLWQGEEGTVDVRAIQAGLTGASVTLNYDREHLAFNAAASRAASPGAQFTENADGTVTGLWTGKAAAANATVLSFRFTALRTGLLETESAPFRAVAAGMSRKEGASAADLGAARVGGTQPTFQLGLNAVIYRNAAPGGDLLLVPVESGEAIVKYGEAELPDVTQAGYQIDGRAYTHVYGWAAPGIDREKLTAFWRYDNVATPTPLRRHGFGRLLPITDDVNGDGAADISDAQTIANIIAGRLAPAGSELVWIRADVDRNGRIDNEDTRALLARVNGGTGDVPQGSRAPVNLLTGEKKGTTLFAWEAVGNAETMMEQITDNLRRNPDSRTSTHYVQKMDVVTASGPVNVPIYFLYNTHSADYGLPREARGGMYKNTQSLYLTPNGMEPVSTAGYEAVNVSVVCGLRTLPTSPDDSAHAVGKFDVQVSLDGTNFIETGAAMRAWKLVGVGTTSTNASNMLFELQSENLLDIPGVKAGDTIRKIRVRPHGKHTHNWGWFELSSITVTGYRTRAEWEAAVPDGHADLYPVGEETMRRITLEQCYRIMDQAWTADESIYSDTPSGGPSGTRFTTVPGVTYHGPIYERALKGDFETMLLDMKNGKYVGGRSTDMLAGMDCTVFAYDAYSRVSRSSSFILWKYADDNSLYMLNSLKTDGCPMYSDTDVIALNDEQTVYGGYAMLKPGDVLATYTTLGGIHVRIVESVAPVRNPDGTFDGAASKVTYVEQTSGIRYYFEKPGGTVEKTRLDTPALFREYVDTHPQLKLLYGACAQRAEQTFANLRGAYYVAYRPMEYDRGSIEALDIQFLLQPADGKDVRSGFRGAAATDYYMDRIVTTLQDRGTGRILFREECRPMTQDKYCYDLNSAELNTILAGLTNGSYRISMSVMAGPVTEPGAARPYTTGIYDFTLSDRAPAARVTLNGVSDLAAGQSADVTVQISAPYDGAAVDVKYDADKLTFVSGTCSAAVGTVTGGQGLVRIAVAGAGASAGQLARLSFTANKACSAADALEIRNADIVTAAAAMGAPSKALDADEACDSAGFRDVLKSAWYRRAVDYVYENNIMSGYSADTFGPDNTLTRAMVVQVLYNKENKPASSAPNPFKDITAGQWYYNAVRWGADKGVVAGYGGGVFKPDDNVTVEQVAVILHNYSGKPASTGDASGLGAHSDWADAALAWAAEKGLFNGMPYDAVTAPATRAQTAQMLMNYLNG